MIVVLHCICKMFETPTFIKVNKQPLSWKHFIKVFLRGLKMSHLQVGIQVDFCFVVILIDSQLSWNVLLLLCIVSKLHSWFVILPGNNEDQLNIWISYYWDHRIKKWRLIIAFKDATYSQWQKQCLKNLGFQTQCYRNQYVIMTCSSQLACQLSWLERCTGIPRSAF